MSDHDRKIIEALEAMPLEQARKEIFAGKHGDVGSPVHLVASTWLAEQERQSMFLLNTEQVSLSTRAIFWARHAAYAAYAAAIIAAVSIIIMIVMAFK